MKFDSYRHVPELDGLRGVAILLVLATHFTPQVELPRRAFEWLRKAAEGGWMGVDLFFVLSGFLITGILLRAKGSPGALKVFFARRALRILPLYLAAAVIAFVLVPLALFLFGAQDPAFDVMRGHQGWVWSHCTNIGVFLYQPHQFNSPTLSVSHFWSLSIEEHFYLIWPFTVMALSRRQLKAFCVALAAASLGIRLMGQALHQSSFFFLLTPCRLDALALGGLLAVYAAEMRLPRFHRPALIVGPICAALLLRSFFTHRGLFITATGLSLIALLFASVIVAILTGKPGGLVARTCRSRLLTAFGKYSYGIYVLHWLAGAQMERLLPHQLFLHAIGIPEAAMAADLATKIGLSFALALISWRVLEQPALRVKERFSYRQEQTARAAHAFAGQTS